MLQKLRQWIRKLSFPISLLLMGVLFFTWTDNWQVYTDPLRELYNRGVQLAGGARMGHTSEPGQQDGTVSISLDNNNSICYLFFIFVVILRIKQ
mgnify:CR=1 FL=1